MGMGARVECLKCGDIIRSYYTHDFKYCKCKAVFVDGGDTYLRIGGEFSDYRVLDNPDEKIQ